MDICGGIQRPAQQIKARQDRCGVESTQECRALGRETPVWWGGLGGGLQPVPWAVVQMSQGPAAGLPGGRDAQPLYHLGLSLTRRGVGGRQGQGRGQLAALPLLSLPPAPSLRVLRATPFSSSSAPFPQLRCRHPLDLLSLPFPLSHSPCLTSPRAPGSEVPQMLTYISFPAVAALPAGPPGADFPRPRGRVSRPCSSLPSSPPGRGPHTKPQIAAL